MLSSGHSFFRECFLGSYPIPPQQAQGGITRRSLNISAQLKVLDLPEFQGRQHSGIDVRPLPTFCQSLTGLVSWERHVFAHLGGTDLWALISLTRTPFFAYPLGHAQRRQGTDGACQARNVSLAKYNCTPR